MTEPYQILEQEFAAWAGLENPVACSSGTAALHLAFESLGLEPGSVVLCPEFTMVACARAIVMAGLRPAFVDCDDALLMDLNKVHNAIDAATTVYGEWKPGRRISAVLAVHVYGRPVDMPRLRRLCEPKGIKIVEDLAEAHGLEPYGSDAQAYSFYRNKVICGEEGGLVAFANPDHAEHARLLRCQGFTAEHNFLHVPRGHNYRMPNCCAELILESLARADENLARRRKIEGLYDAYLFPWRMPPRDVVWVHDIRVPGMKEPEQDAIVRRLNGAGIAARHAFKPMSRQPEFHTHPYEHLNAHRLSCEVIYLPVDPEFTHEQVSGIAEQTRLVLEELVPCVRSSKNC